VSIVLIVHQSDVRRGRGMAQRRCWPGLVSHYASLPPHDRETVTRPGQIGIAASALAHLLVRHVLVEYAGVPVDSDRRPTRLSRAALGRVHDLIEAEANLSHFRRVFRAHTGATPSQFRALTG
jgi:hypothetical protein